MTSSRVFRSLRIPGAIALLSGAGPRLSAQARPDSTKCDSIVASAAVDSVATGVFITVEQLDGNWMSNRRQDLIVSRIASSFVAPHPFGLSVFQGPSLVRGFRIVAPGDSVGVRRATSIVGAYRLDVTDHGAMDGPVVVRASLLPGLDSAMARAIRSAAKTGNSLRPESGDRWRLEVRVSTDSLDEARRVAEGMFPVFSISDASVITRRRPAFPADALADSLDHGEAVLRFVVDRDGKPALETIELVRASALPFARAAIVALGDQRFNPATVRGCPVAQLVEIPFIFDAEDHPPPRGR